jgi:hypothetical protein
MSALGAICDISRNLFYVFVAALIGFGAYTFFTKASGEYLVYLAIGGVVSLVVWRATKLMLP